jgi:hypothetical protein
MKLFTVLAIWADVLEAYLVARRRIVPIRRKKNPELFVRKNEKNDKLGITCMYSKWITTVSGLLNP